MLYYNHKEEINHWELNPYKLKAGAPGGKATGASRKERHTPCIGWQRMATKTNNKGEQQNERKQMQIY